jgi:protein TonB
MPAPVSKDAEHPAGWLPLELAAPMNQRTFWIASFLSATVHGACLALIWVAQHLSPVSAPMILLPFGDSDVKGMSVSALSVDPGSLVQATEDRPGGEVIRGPIHRTPAPMAMPEAAQPPGPKALAAPISSADAVELAKSTPHTEVPANDEPAEIPELPTPTPTPPRTEQAPPEEPPPSLQSTLQPALAARAAADAARGLTAPNGLGTNPKEAPGVGTAAGQQGSSRMATRAPSAGGRVGYTNGVSLVSYPRPYYPPEARSAGMQGTVPVWLKVSTEGKVVEAWVDQSCGYAILDDAAVRFAYTVRLQPAPGSDSRRRRGQAAGRRSLGRLSCQSNQLAGIAESLKAGGRRSHPQRWLATPFPATAWCDPRCGRSPTARRTSRP